MAQGLKGGNCVSQHLKEWKKKSYGEMNNKIRQNIIFILFYRASIKSKTNNIVKGEQKKISV